MSEELIVRHCSPTLAGIKTGSMFNCSFSSKAELISSLRLWNRILSRKGLRVLPLRIKADTALIYLFCPTMLSKDLKHETACALLSERGYLCDIPERCVTHLIKRIHSEKEFPHEIGLFLGYPPDDVNGFIENSAQGYKCVGCWKVYGDERTAKRLFRQYEKCTAKYCKRLAQGKQVITA